MENEININADFLAFQNQIVEKFGEQYFEQVKIFFERALAQAKKGLLHSATAYSNFALELSNYSNDKIGVQYLIGFIAQIHCDIGQIKKAKAYYELGIKLLDADDEDYPQDKKMYDELKSHLDSEGWKERDDTTPKED